MSLISNSLDVRYEAEDAEYVGSEAAVKKHSDDFPIITIVHLDSLKRKSRLMVQRMS